MADDIPMDVLSSSGASDASSFCSTGPTTPASSPLFRPSGSDDLAVLTQLAHLRSIESVASEPVKSVCVVGAGYVGRSVEQTSETSTDVAGVQVAQRQQFWRCTTRPSRSRC